MFTTHGHNIFHLFRTEKLLNKKQVFSSIEELYKYFIGYAYLLYVFIVIIPNIFVLFGI